MPRAVFAVLVVAPLVCVAFACGSSDDAPAAPLGESDGGVDEAGDTGMPSAPLDNGAPSTHYPAPHPALPDLVNGSKGPVLKTPKIAYIFYPDEARAAELETFATKLAASPYWAATTTEYGVGPIAYAGKFELTGETAPAMISQAEISAKIASLLTSGTLGVPDPQTIYTIVFPSGTTVTQPNPITTLFGPIVSCTSFTGYHDNVAVALDDAGAAKTDFAYAVIPTCAAGAAGLTSTLSHEWVEASTDPLVTTSGVFSVQGGPNAAFYAPDGDHSVWSLLGGGEAGDLCENSGPTIEITPPEIGYPVQRTWSNVAARGSHDPCVPQLPNAPYFAAAPVITKTVKLSTSFTGDVITKGIVIPVGESATIEVDLFSDGPLTGPIKVQAADLLHARYGSYGFAKSMDFSWDRTQGVNGEKLHLTVTVNTSSFLGGGHAFVISAINGNRQQLWPGLVLEQ